jgi:hypothetical protein
MLGISACFYCTHVNFDAMGDSILRELKNACMEDPGNPAFWNEVKKRRADLGLITASEAAKHGGKSSIADKSTEEVRGCTVLEDLTNPLPVLVKVIMTIILASAYIVYPIVIIVPDVRPPSNDLRVFLRTSDPISREIRGDPDSSLLLHKTCIF